MKKWLETDSFEEAFDKFNDNVDEIEQGFDNRYTKQEVDDELNTKADKLDTYTKTEVDNSLGLKANKQQEAWMTPTLLNGFTGEIRYRINEFNNLEIIGSLTFTSRISINSLPSFQLPMSYVPNWFIPGTSYKDQRFKFSIPTDDTQVGSARAALSSYNGNFIITHGNNFDQWHINISIPMSM